MNPYQPTTGATTPSPSLWRWTLLLLPPVAFSSVVGMAYVSDQFDLYVLTLILLAFGTLGAGIGTSIEVAKELGRGNRLLVFVIGTAECLVVLVPYAFMIDGLARRFP